MSKFLHVAVGAVIDTDGNILIAQRAPEAHQGGLWEFPGGKVDSGESVSEALARELSEEVGISVQASQPLIQIRHHYAEKSVLLDVYKVTQFKGEASGKEGQPINWVKVNALANYPFPAANRPIITALELPDKLLVTGNFLSLTDFIERLHKALSAGIQLVQLRVPELNLSKHAPLLEQTFTLCQEFSAQLSINTGVDIFNQIRRDQSPGLHLNRHELFIYQKRPVPADIRLSASCHNGEEIAQATKIGVDYLVLSPVLATSSHPDATPLGWSVAAELIKTANIPVYILGGMTDAELPQAKMVGAQGVAALSSWWEQP